MFDKHDDSHSTPLTLQIMAESAKDATEAMKLTSDPIDAMRLASDLYAISAYRAERALSAATHVPAPPAPQPISNVMRDLQTTLKAQLCAIIELLSPDERKRLQALAPGVAHQMDLGDEDFTHEIGLIVAMAPADAVAWIRVRLAANELAP